MLNAMIRIARSGVSTKIHAIADAYGSPMYMLLSKGQRNVINMTIPLLEQLSPNGSQVLADRGYDSNTLIGYIYGRGEEGVT